MSLFDDMLSGSDGVYTITNRSDLVAESKLAIRQATLAAHRSDYFPRDLIELLVAPGSASIFQLDIPTYFLNWRAFKYLRPYDSVGAALSGILIGAAEFLAPDAILDEYLVEKVNVAYVAGNNLNVRLQEAYDSLIVGYYANPILSPEASYESWIAREQPAVVVLDAAARVLTAIGYEEAAGRLRIMLYGVGGSPANPTGGEYMLLKQSALEGVGR